MENGLKNQSEGFTDLKIENKIIPIDANSEAGIRYHVKQLDLYLSKIPAKAHELDIFYLRPLPKDPTKPWFAAAPTGKNKLGTMVKDMFVEVGITGKTNHNLRATCTTEFYTANIPMIQQHTRHGSLKVLCIYERTTQEQKLAVSKVLTSYKKIDYIVSLPSEQSKVGAWATQIVSSQQSPVLSAEKLCNQCGPQNLNTEGMHEVQTEAIPTLLMIAEG